MERCEWCFWYDGDRGVCRFVGKCPEEEEKCEV